MIRTPAITLCENDARTDDGGCDGRQRKIRAAAAEKTRNSSARKRAAAKRPNDRAARARVYTVYSANHGPAGRLAGWLAGWLARRPAGSSARTPADPEAALPPTVRLGGRCGAVRTTPLSHNWIRTHLFCGRWRRAFPNARQCSRSFYRFRAAKVAYNNVIRYARRARLTLSMPPPQ